MFEVKESVKKIVFIVSAAVLGVFVLGTIILGFAGVQIEPVLAGISGSIEFLAISGIVVSMELLVIKK